MFKVGDSIRHNGKFGKVTKVGEYQVSAYMEDSTGGYHIEIPLSALNSSEMDYELNKCLGVDLSILSEKETVAKPARYTQGSIEVWEAIHQLGADFRQGSVIKYTMRYKHKNGAEDLKKAMNYLAKMLAEETGEDYYELRKKSLDEL